MPRIIPASIELIERHIKTQECSSTIVTDEYPISILQTIKSHHMILGGWLGKQNTPCEDYLVLYFKHNGKVFELSSKTPDQDMPEIAVITGYYYPASPEEIELTPTILEPQHFAHYTLNKDHLLSIWKQAYEKRDLL